MEAARMVCFIYPCGRRIHRTERCDGALRVVLVKRPGRDERILNNDRWRMDGSRKDGALHLSLWPEDTQDEATREKALLITVVEARLAWVKSMKTKSRLGTHSRGDGEEDSGGNAQFG